MSWHKEVYETELRKELSNQQGGEESVANHHAKGRQTIRERIEGLVDNDSFEEHGEGAGFAEKDADGAIKSFSPANYVVGFGTVNGQRIAVGGEDFTFKGGSPNAAGLRKSVYAEHLAVQFRIPLVRMLEGGGGSVAGSSGTGQRPATAGSPVYSEPRFKIIAQAMNTVPVVSGAMGPVAGFPAGRLVASHFSVMVKDTSQVMVAGPAVVERALGVASAAHFAPNTYQLAWPSYEMGALPVEGGVAVAFHREIAEADDPDTKRKELEENLAANRSPFPLMESFAVHELIDPRQTRSRLCRWIEWIEPMMEELKGPVTWGMRP